MLVGICCFLLPSINGFQSSSIPLSGLIWTVGFYQKKWHIPGEFHIKIFETQGPSLRYSNHHITHTSASGTLSQSSYSWWRKSRWRGFSRFRNLWKLMSEDDKLFQSIVFRKLRNLQYITTGKFPYYKKIMGGNNNFHDKKKPPGFPTTKKSWGGVVFSHPG